MDDQNQEKQPFDLNNNTPEPEQSAQIKDNPLNTGNGAPANSEPVSAIPPTHTPAPKTPTPTVSEPAPVPTITKTPGDTATSEDNPSEPHKIDISTIDGTPATPTTDSKEKSTKKYIIIAIVTVLVVTIGFAAYIFLSGNSEEEAPSIETPLTNTLSSDSEEISEEMEEVVELVEELKDVYPKESPPSLILDLSGSNETEKTTEKEPSKFSR